MDEQLAPGLLTRTDAGGRPEAGRVEALSFGAREQLGLMMAGAVNEGAQA